MTQTTISKVISLVIIAVLSIAFIDSTARADNASGVTYRSVAIDGVEHYKRDLKNLEYHLLDTGHFALETHGQEIAGLIRDFLGRSLPVKNAAR